MNESEEKNSIIYKQEDGKSVHHVLLLSYFIFLFGVILGVFFDTFLDRKLFSNNIYQYIGLGMLFVSTIIIYWAQVTSSNYKERDIKDEKRSQFQFGPYRYNRSPTHFALFILTLGFSLIINSFFSVVFTWMAYIITKRFFLRQVENKLELKYGEDYTEYKRKVKNWL